VEEAGGGGEEERQVGFWPAVEKVDSVQVFLMREWDYSELLRLAVRGWGSRDEREGMK
jgi:hypothetical protein